MNKENLPGSQIVPNQVFTIFPGSLHEEGLCELCHARDSGAVAIAPLVRRSAANYFSLRTRQSVAAAKHAFC
jgi:hypothetical protein